MLLKEVFVAMGLDVDEAAFAKGELAASLVEAGMRKIVEVGKEVVGAFIENAKEAIEYGDKIRKTSQSIGIAVDALQELQYAGQMSGVSSEEMTGAITILTRNMKAAKDGAEAQSKAFSKLGIKVKDADGKLRGADDILSDVANNLAKMDDGAEKTALAMEFFGKSGAKMIPLLNEGTEGIEELRAEARELGLVMTDDAARAAEELGDNFERLHNLSRGLWRAAIAPLLPALNELVERFLKWRKENAAIMASKIQAFLGTMIKGIHKLVDLMDFLTKNAEGLKIVLGVGGLTTVVIGLATWMAKLGVAGVWAATKTAAAWIAAAAPFAAIAAIVAGFMLLFDDIRTYNEGGDSLYGRFKKEIDDWLKPRDEDPWFVTALKYFVRLLRDTIEVMLELDEIFGDGKKKSAFLDKQAGKNRKQITAESDAQTIETARKRSQLGLPMTDAARAALKRGGVSQEAFEQKYNPSTAVAAPSVPAPSVSAAPSVPVTGGGAASVSAPMQFGPFVQQPGQSAKQLAIEVGRVVENVLQGKISAAVAGVRGGT